VLVNHYVSVTNFLNYDGYGESNAPISNDRSVCLIRLRIDPVLFSMIDPLTYQSQVITNTLVTQNAFPSEKPLIRSCSQINRRSMKAYFTLARLHILLTPILCTCSWSSLPSLLGKAFFGRNPNCLTLILGYMYYHVIFTSQDASMEDGGGGKFWRRRAGDLPDQLACAPGSPLSSLVWPPNLNDVIRLCT
jgi:hypothetical protein